VLAALGNISPGAFVLTLAISALLSLAVFWHASKHGNKHATAWGIATFLFAGIILPVYVIYYLMTSRRRY
jgi:hypothetical protein